MQVRLYLIIDVKKNDQSEIQNLKDGQDDICGAVLDTLSQDYLSYISNLVKNNKTPLKKKNCLNVEEDQLNERNKIKKAVREEENNQSKSLPSQVKNSNTANLVLLKSGINIVKNDKQEK